MFSNRARSVAVICILVMSFADSCADKTYKSCDEMRKDHAAPVSQGEKNYSRSLDKDHDGIACEKGE